MLDNSFIKETLNSVKTIAMVGVSSAKEEKKSVSIKRRPSIIVMQYLKEFGYKVIPVNPFSKEEKICEEKVFSNLEDINVPIDVVLEISVPDDEIVRRLSGRRVHLDSGRVYHVTFNPPKVDGADDVTGEKLIQRNDDKEDTVRNRLTVYHQQTEPLVNFYTELSESGCNVNVIKVNGVSELNVIKEEIFRALN